MTWNWESFVFAIIAFAILYFLLNKYAFGALFNVMEKRRQLVLEQIESAEKNRQQSEELLSQHQAAMHEARNEAKAILDQARAMSAKQAEELILEARNEAARLKSDALRDIENEKNKALSSLKSQVSAMSVLIASKIIEKQVDEKTQEELVHHYLNEVGGEQ